MSFLRFLMLLSLVVWIGGVIFLAFVEAPTAFRPGLLPSRHLAGSVVGNSLTILHWMGLISGIVFLASSIAYNQITRGTSDAFALRHIFIVLMLLLTAYSQFGITPRMVALRSSFVEIDQVPVDDPGRVEFDKLHNWSEKLEGGVLLMGLVVVYLTARQLGSS
jgi:uncharacterized membrane protein